MTKPLFAMQSRYQGTYIPGITMTNWFYVLVPIFPAGVVGVPVQSSTGPVANAGLNDLDIVNVQWQVQVGAVAYNLYRKPNAIPVPGTDPIWASFTAETGVKDKGFPAMTRS